MDVAYPIHAVVPTLDGPVLEVLARTSRPLNAREVQRIARTGSPNGVRLVLARLAEQGVVHAEERARIVFYVANREHLVWPAVEALAGLRRELVRRLRGEINSWQVAPIHVSLYGSAARGDGDARSDIDVLLVHPDGLGEEDPPWTDQVDRLRARVEIWTGNRCQIFQVDLDRLTEYVRTRDPLVDDWLRDAVALGGADLRDVLRHLPPASR